MNANAKVIARRLKAAKARAMYWSGIPSSAGYCFIPAADNGRNHDDEYELALTDVRALQDALTVIDGKPLGEFDPRADFRRRYSEMMAARAAGAK